MVLAKKWLQDLDISKSPKDGRYGTGQCVKTRLWGSRRGIDEIQMEDGYNA